MQDSPLYYALYKLLLIITVKNLEKEVAGRF